MSLSNIALHTTPRVLLILALLSACAQSPRPPESRVNHVVPVATDAKRCASLLGVPSKAPVEPIRGSNFSIAVWNAQKGTVDDSAWSVDLDALFRYRDLVLLQEFVMPRNIESSSYWSFTAGFNKGPWQTGVLTASRSEPLVHCALNGREPLLRTLKATAITEFALDGGDRLVVVNVHAVNFSLGLKRFREQLDQARLAVAGHQGPLIFSGDFNTWSGRRMRTVDRLLMDQLDLQPVTFADDQRVRRFGRPLDHVYVRGLDVLDATIRAVATSDHNPLMVNLRARAGRTL